MRLMLPSENVLHNLPIAPNLLERNFSPEAPNQVWTSDITYIPTDEGWLYLTSVIDLFSRTVVGWSMKDNMQTNAVTDALRMAWFRRRPPPNKTAITRRGFLVEPARHCGAAPHSVNHSRIERVFRLGSRPVSAGIRRLSAILE